MYKKLTTSGIILVVAGALLFIIGIGMFFSFFMSIAGDPFSHDPFGPRGGMPNPAMGFGGILLLGLGTFLFKIGLGLTIAGQSENAVKWYKKTTGDDKSSVNWYKKAENEAKKCPNCASENKSDAKYCSSCGAQLFIR